MRGNGGSVTVQPENSRNTPASTGSIAAEHVVLRDERQLDVELVELARRAIGARVLVAEAGRDLEVAVEAGDHQQLLELLRRLRQRVELARMDPARHEVVACALGRARGEDRRLELEKALRVHPPADARDHLRAQHDVAVQLLAPQVEEAVAQPLLFRNLLRARPPGTAASRPATAPRRDRPRPRRRRWAAPG